jgi:carboxypeptidase PM20D1
MGFILIGILIAMFCGIIGVCAGRTLYLSGTSHGRENPTRIAARNEPVAGTLCDSDDPQSTRLSQAIGFRTVSYADRRRIDFSPYRKFIEFLAQSFPLVHDTLRLEQVNEYTLFYTWPGTDQSSNPILLMAHYDVVPADADDGWTHDPFEGTIEGGFLYGRGTLDDKHCLMAILESIESLLHDGYTPTRSVYLCFGHDEEIGGVEGAGTVAGMLEERGIALDWVLDEGSMIYDAELLPGIAMPVALIGITEKGHVDVALESRANPGHAATPPRRTSVGRVAAAVAAIERKPFPPRLSPVVQQFLESLIPYAPVPLKVALSNLWLFKPLFLKTLSGKPNTDAMIRTTQAATCFTGSDKENILPARARASFNVRLLHGDTIRAVISRYKRIIGRGPLSVEPMVESDFCDPLPVSNIDGEGYTLVSTLAAQMQPPVVCAPFIVLGATDSRHFRNISRDILRFLPIRLAPDQIRLLHGVDERISLREYAGMIRFYGELLRRL